MIQEYYFAIPGIPQAKKRPRFSRRGGFMRTYDPQEKEKKEYIEVLSEAFLEEQQAKDCKIEMEGPNSPFLRFYFLTVWYYLPISDTLKKAQKNANYSFIYHISRPDVDNLTKFFMDCANGVLWPDDSKICQINASKIYSDNPHTQVHLKIIEVPKPIKLKKGKNVQE